MSEIIYEYAQRRYLPQILKMSMDTQIEHAHRQPDVFRKDKLSKTVQRFYRKSFLKWGVFPASVSQKVATAIKDDQLVGYVGIDFQKNKHKHMYAYWTAVIVDIRVDPAFQKQGIAGKLVDFATGLAKEKGCLMLYASVWRDNVASQNLFLSQNFQEEYRTFKQMLVDPEKTNLD